MNYVNSEMTLLINELVHSERDRKILQRKMIDDVHYEILAEEFELSVAQVKRIVKKEREKLFWFLALMSI